MPEQSQKWLDDTTLRVMTYKSGSFTFAIHIDVLRLQATIDRVNDAQLRFNKMPGLPQIIDQMQDKILASSVYSTNTIEGGEFTEAETEKILKTDPKLIQKTEERRLTNLKQAIEWVKQHSQKTFQPNQGQPISIVDILNLHEMVSQGVDEVHNPPRQFRNNQPTQTTHVGNVEHGGRYRPPKCIEDIEYLMQAWITWLNHSAILEQPALVRASLAHYYFELIHPFWDGNGRTGRLIEMLILEQSGYRFSSSAIWKFYQQNIHQYFALFNQCRKLADKKDKLAQHDFVDFTVRGMLDTINDLHDQGNDLIRFLLFQTQLNSARNQRVLSERQIQIVEILLRTSEFPTASDLYRNSAIQALFINRTERTYFRDIEKLVELGFLQEHKGVLFLGL